MSEEEIIKICKLICGTKNKNGKREYKTIQRMNLLKNYTEDKLEEAIEGLLNLYEAEKEKNHKASGLIKKLEPTEDLYDIEKILNEHVPRID